MSSRWKIERWLAELYPGEEHVYSHYEDLAPRELTIVACAVLDAALAELISLRLREDEPEVISFLGANEDGRAPAATFGARIQLAYLLGLLNSNTVVLLRALKNLRNVMAHRVKVDLLSPQAQAALRPLQTEWGSRLGGTSSQIVRNVHLLTEASRTNADAAEMMVRIWFMMLQASLRDIHGRVVRLLPLQ